MLWVLEPVPLSVFCWRFCSLLTVFKNCGHSWIFFGVNVFVSHRELLSVITGLPIPRMEFIGSSGTMNVGRVEVGNFLDGEVS